MTSSFYKRCATALLVVLCAATAIGCQSLEPMSRPDAAATMSRPDDWPRDRGQDVPGTLFVIRHPSLPVRMRLRRLPSPIIDAAHATWARLWLEESFEAVDVAESSDGRLGGNQARRVVAHVRDDEMSLDDELLIANAGGETYVLETWGTPDALAKTREMRGRIAASTRLPTSPPTTTGDQDPPSMISGSDWRLALPQNRDTSLPARWQVEQQDAEHARFSLPSRLLTVEVVGEDLDYPLSAAKYAGVALRRAFPDGGMDIGVADDAATAQVTSDAGGAVPMRYDYRFITRGERALQLVVSTPASLYEKNHAVIDALAASLEFLSGDAQRDANVE